MERGGLGDILSIGVSSCLKSDSLPLGITPLLRRRHPVRGSFVASDSPLFLEPVASSSLPAQGAPVPRIPLTSPSEAGPDSKAQVRSREASPSPSPLRVCLAWTAASRPGCSHGGEAGGGGQTRGVLWEHSSWSWLRSLRTCHTSVGPIWGHQGIPSLSCPYSQSAPPHLPLFKFLQSPVHDAYEGLPDSILIGLGQFHNVFPVGATNTVRRSPRT